MTKMDLHLYMVAFEKKEKPKHDIIFCVRINHVSRVIDKQNEHVAIPWDML